MRIECTVMTAIMHNAFTYEYYSHELPCTTQYIDKHTDIDLQQTYGDRAFCFSGPREWNKLSLEIRQSKSVEVFKTKLKTLLFKEYYKKKGVCG